jgi:hypothetical protein
LVEFFKNVGAGATKITRFLFIGVQGIGIEGRIELDGFVRLESIGGMIDVDFLSIFIDGVFFLPDHGLDAIDAAFHDPDGISYFAVVLETGVEGLVGLGGKIGPEGRIILVAVGISDGGCKICILRIHGR